MTDQLLPGTEADLVRVAQRNMEKRGAQIDLNSKVSSLEKSGGRVKARLSTPSGDVTVETSLALVSVGREPLTDGLNLSKIGVETDPKGFILTDQQMKTNVEGVYAIGD